MILIGVIDMSDLSELVLEEIKKQFKSVKSFARAIDVPHTTLVSALKKGIGGTAYDTVTKILDTLGIKRASEDMHIVMTDDVINLMNMFSSLDEKGAHAVMAFTAMEFNRSKGSDDYIERAIVKSNEIALRKIPEGDIPEPVIVG